MKDHVVEATSVSGDVRAGRNPVSHPEFTHPNFVRPGTSDRTFCRTEHFDGDRDEHNAESLTLRLPACRHS